MSDLLKLPGAKEIHSKMQSGSVANSIRKHVDARVDLYYPESTFPMPHGAVPELFKSMANDQEKTMKNVSSHESAFDLKQSTMADAQSTSYHDLFSTVRPSMVVDEASVENIVSQDTKMEHALKAVAVVDASMTNKFEDQWIPQYMSRIFPWVLNYSCGGAEYPGLFDKAAWSASEVGDDVHDPIALGVAQRWRRLANSPILRPGEAAQLYATRCEAQIGADWMCIPAARNLHWRYQILHQAFLVCKGKVAPGESADVNLQLLVDAATNLFQRYNWPNLMFYFLTNYKLKGIDIVNKVKNLFANNN